MTAELTDRIVDLYERHLNPGLVRLMKTVGLTTMEKQAHGCIVVDAFGNEWLDCIAGFGALNFGHRHPKIVNAVRRQLDEMPLSSRVLFNSVQAELAAMLAEMTPSDLQFSFFCHSGAEAVEATIKLARLATGRQKIVVMQNAHHGKTLGALSASGREVYKRPFEPLLNWFVAVPFGNADELAKVVDGETAAVLLEPIQGEAGVIVPPDDYLPKVREICDKAKALLIADEVQTGIGRTGKDFAIQHYGVTPDLMALAKSLGGGVMPLGASVGTERAFAALSENPLLHSSTLGGNPLACAAGIAALQVLREEGLSERADELGRMFLATLQQIADDHSAMVQEVRGKGLLIGVEFHDEMAALLVMVGMVQRRVLVAYTQNNQKVIRIEPPLVITKEQLQRVADAFAEATATAEVLMS